MGGSVGAHVNLRLTQGQHRSQNCKFNADLGQSWSNEVKSHIRRLKSMEKINTMSKVNSEDKSSEFKAKRSMMTSAEQSQRTI